MVFGFFRQISLEVSVLERYTIVMSFFKDLGSAIGDLQSFVDDVTQVAKDSANDVVGSSSEVSEQVTQTGKQLINEASAVTDSFKQQLNDIIGK